MKLVTPILLVSIALALASQSFADELHHIGDRRYQTIMSNDDNICKPLLDVYNKLLVENGENLGPTPGADNGEGESGPLYWQLNFEALVPQKFAEAGFVLPPTQDISIEDEPFKTNSTRVIPRHHTATVSLLPLFGEEKPRMVQLGTSLHHNEPVSTQIWIFKKEAEYKETKDKNGLIDRDPTIIDREVGFEGLTKEQGRMPGGYLMKQLPHFWGLYGRYLEALDEHNPGNRVQAPASRAPSSGQIFLYEGRPYFILNNYGYYPGTGDSNIVLYELTQAGHFDICYLNLPSD